ncbi:3-hydroxybutyrate dehydrogenase [Arthrobacter sp. H14-L1]|uniref:3-hydroxybutyrate dehydrogenase n=1 Tax=Arthrobacter sp. H14-L1 TaxID=2996697 RepID=UPI00226DBA43|nr:3-hydroxybutyrate dehydrogenase [Arthrobacter sp. H14-L1]MCY0904584.1 3-hydroxybutyrate dehydrogenase [Arthrobacter sp. H14-L1]
MTQQLQGRAALVTGAASGIGEAIARAFAAEGARVIVADLNGDAAAEVASGIGGEAWTIDLTDRTAVMQRRLDVDIVVNNAGFQHVREIQDFDPDTFHKMLVLMVEAPFLLVRSALPAMYERGFGRIINVSSVHGLRASAFKSAYVTAKHALEGLSKTIALEGAEHGVTSNCINPGYVNTPLVQKQLADQARVHNIPVSEVVEKVLLEHNPIKRMVEPEDVASLALWLAGPHASMVTGASYSMDGGWTAQ